jgi:hypothetical protein
LRKLTVDYDGNASSGAAALTLQVYDFVTGRWTVADGPRTGITADRSVTWSNSISPADYVSPAGEVRFRVRAAPPRFAPAQTSCGSPSTTDG